MSNKNGIITAPVDLETDICGVLGIGAPYDLGRACSSSNINPWSKYKPVRGGADNEHDINSNWWAGTDGKCGFTITFTNDKYDKLTVENFYKNSNNWKYNAPTGGDSSPYRQDDFNGYQHISVPFLRSNYKKGQTTSIPAYPGILSYYYTLSDVDDIKDSDEITYLDKSKNLTIQDFFLCKPFTDSSSLADGYLAVILAQQDKDPIQYGFLEAGFDISNRIRINNTKIRDGGTSLQITDFSSGVLDVNQPFWMVGGIVFGSNKQCYIGLPFDDNHYPSTKFQFYWKSYFLSAEIVGWSKYPTLTRWYNIVWVETDDVVAFPAMGSNSYLQVKLRFDSTSWISDIDLSGKLRFYCRETKRETRPSFMTSSFTGGGDSIMPVNTIKDFYLNISDLFAMERIGDRYTIDCYVKYSAASAEQNILTFAFEGRTNY